MRTVVGLLVLLTGCAPVTGDAPRTSATSLVPEAPSTVTAAPGPSPAAVGGASAEVRDVTDGDTIEVRVGGEPETVRLIGINAPERGECYSQPAARELSELVAGRPVRLVPDVSDRDQYGRLLRYVFVGDVHVNAELVRRGAAIAHDHPPDTSRSRELRDAERSAREQERGLWSTCRSTTDAALELDIQADAPGDDGQNPNGEWIDITNVGPSELDLSGWTLRDASSSHRYVFAPGTALPSGTTLRLRTGCGTDTALERYWCSRRSAVWNNDGDVAFLLDASGRIVVREAY